MATIFALPPPPVNEIMPSPAWSDWFYKLQQYIKANTGTNADYYSLTNRPPIPAMSSETIGMGEGESDFMFPPGGTITSSSTSSIGPFIYAFAAAHG